VSSNSDLSARIQAAEQALRNNRRPEAILIYQEVSALADRDAGLHYQLGNLVTNIGDIGRAAEHYQIACDESPDNTDYLSALGIALQNSGEPVRSFEALQRALGLNPDQPSALHAMGVHYLHRSQNQQAVDCLQRAAELKPSDAAIRTNLATALMPLDRYEEAIEHANKAIKLDPSDERAHYTLCKALTETGQMEETTKHLRKTIRQHRNFGPAYDLLARVKKFTAEDDEIVRSAEAALKQGMPPLHRYSLHFALGKMHADRGDYDKSFEHYQQANNLQDPGIDLKRDTQLVREIKTAFDEKWLRASASHGNPSEQPVFIVGMPRSGTTLMEQMIAAHPDAEGAGELYTIGQIAELVFPRKDKRQIRRQVQENLTAEKCQEFAEIYLNVLNEGREGAKRIVDKMPSNFLFVGLIELLFPKATIIHAVRNPMDTGLSCYRQNFAHLYWSNKLESIADFYALYRETMKFWERVLPPGRMVRIEYEKLVEDPETEGRRLLEACGLEWDAEVLEFFRKGRAVRTASIAQVRQPIYKSSKRSWVKYGKHLEPMARRMAPFLQDERDLLAEHGIDIGSRGGFLNRLFG
jgi:tetratricopeptide (TPR) repeat protein